MNPGPPGPCLVRRDVPDRSERRAPTLVRDVDLREPLPDIPGGVLTRAWLLMRVGGVAVGQLLVAVPENGLRSEDLGAVIARRVGADRRRPAPDKMNRQLRERNRGRISSE
jgi:hypothetical protein